MLATFRAGLTLALDVALAGGALLYVGTVIMSYRMDGPHARLELDLLDPIRSAWRLLVWLGVRLVSSFRSSAECLFAELSETSAEIGESFFRGRGPKLQATVRSRFLL